MYKYSHVSGQTKVRRAMKTTTKHRNISYEQNAKQKAMLMLMCVHTPYVASPSLCVSHHDLTLEFTLFFRPLAKKK